MPSFIVRVRIIAQNAHDAQFAVMSVKGTRWAQVETPAQTALMALWDKTPSVKGILDNPKEDK